VSSLRERFRKSEISLRAAALSFHSLLCFLPLLSLIFWYLKKIGVARSWRETTKNFILDHFNVSTGPEIERAFNQIATISVKHYWKFGIFSFVLLVITSWSMVTKLGDGLDRMAGYYDHKLSTTHSVRLTVRRMLLMFLLPLALLGSLFATSWLMKAEWIKALLVDSEFLKILSTPISWSADFVGIFLMYLLVPKMISNVTRAFLAALIVTPLYSFVKTLFVAYNAQAVGLTQIYGALAALPLFLIWLHMSWMIFLSGAFMLKPKNQ